MLCMAFAMLSKNVCLSVFLVCTLQHCVQTAKRIGKILSSSGGNYFYEIEGLLRSQAVTRALEVLTSRKRYRIEI